MGEGARTHLAGDDREEREADEGGGGDISEGNAASGARLRFGLISNLACCSGGKEK